jgi:hypothetical protein
VGFIADDEIVVKLFEESDVLDRDVVFESEEAKSA